MRRLVPWLVLLAHLLAVAPAQAAARKTLLVLNPQSEDAPKPRGKVRDADHATSEAGGRTSIGRGAAEVGLQLGF